MRSPGPPAHEAASAVPPVRSPGPPAHETASAVPPVRRLSLPAHEAASAVPPVRSPGPPAHETASAVPPCAALALLLTRQPRQSLPCAASAVPPVRSPGPPAHEAASAVPPVAAPALLLTRQPRQSLPCADLAFLLTRRIKIRPSYVRGSLLRTGGLWNPFLSPGRIAGHSRVALWPYCHLHEEFRLCWQTEIGADELDF